MFRVLVAARAGVNIDLAHVPSLRDGWLVVGEVVLTLLEVALVDEVGRM